MSALSHLVSGLSVDCNDGYKEMESVFYDNGNTVIFNNSVLGTVNLIGPFCSSVTNVWNAMKAIGTFRYFKDGIIVGLLYSGGEALKIVASPLYFLAMECVSIASLSLAFLAIPSLVVGKNWSKTILLSGIAAMNEFEEFFIAPGTFLKKVAEKGQKHDSLATVRS